MLICDDVMLLILQVLANQMDSLRGRELPGFMSSQSFYMFMAQYVEAWREPARAAVSEVSVYFSIHTVSFVQIAHGMLPVASALVVLNAMNYTVRSHGMSGASTDA